MFFKTTPNKIREWFGFQCLVMDKMPYELGISLEFNEAEDRVKFVDLTHENRDKDILGHLKVSVDGRPFDMGVISSTYINISEKEFIRELKYAINAKKDNDAFYERFKTDMELKLLMDNGFDFLVHKNSGYRDYYGAGLIGVLVKPGDLNVFFNKAVKPIKDKLPRLHPDVGFSLQAYQQYVIEQIGITVIGEQSGASTRQGVSADYPTECIQLPSVWYEGFLSHITSAMNGNKESLAVPYVKEAVSSLNAKIRNTFVSA